MYEQCSVQSYERKLNKDDRPILVQRQWPREGMFSFVLRRSMKDVEDNAWVGRPAHSDRETWASDRVAERETWENDREVREAWSGDREKRNIWTDDRADRNAWSDGRTERETWSNDRGERWSCKTDVWGESESWPECNKGSEEHHVTDDMDTSVSSNGSPTPPSTSSPLSSGSSSSSSSSPPSPISPCTTILPKPPGPDKQHTLPKPHLPTFFFPSPDLSSFSSHPLTSTPHSSSSPSFFPRPPPLTSSPYSLSSLPNPSRPHGRSSLPSMAPSSCQFSLAPILPPKPASLSSLFTARQTTTCYNDYENYFYI